MEAEGRETILAGKGIIIKEIEIKQDPIVEIKATGVETHGVNIKTTIVYMPPYTSWWSYENYPKLTEEM